MALAPWNAPNLKLTGSSSRAAAIAGGANAGNRSSAIGSGSTLRVSGSEPTAKLGPQSVMDLINKQGTVGTNQQGPLKTGYVTAEQAQTRANQTLQNRVTAATPTGSVVAAPVQAGPTGPAGPGGSGDGSKKDTTGETQPTEETPAEGEKQDVAAMLNALINQLLEADFLGFQGERAAELRRLQNLRNQLYGDTEFGTTGSIQRQQQLDAAARRRLAASRAVAGMLGGGAYAGTQRGVGTIQRADQDFALQEMERPFREQTAADRLREFGLTFTPEGRLFDLSNFGLPNDIMGGWAKETWGGKQAAARARLAALEQLRQRGMTL